MVMYVILNMKLLNIVGKIVSDLQRNIVLLNVLTF